MSIQIDSSVQTFTKKGSWSPSDHLDYTNIKGTWPGYANFDHEFDFEHREDFFKEVNNSLTGLQFPMRIKRHRVYNMAASFDIEVSSFRLPRNGKKAACMYIWQFGLNGSVIYGRTWSQFKLFLSELKKFFGLGLTLSLIVYVHNLSYEFQFLKTRLNFDRVFALKKRKVLEAELSDRSIIFRCSYLLSNANLEFVGEKLCHTYPVKKLVGKLDYSKIRSSSTPLTKDELDYSLNDVRVVMSYIQEKIEMETGIINIPLTNTGYVRNLVRDACLGTKEERLKYQTIMDSLQIDSDEEYEENKRCLLGGFTHSGILHANQTLYNVGSADRTSAYPTEMVCNYFPMSRARLIDTSEMTEEQFKYYLTRYCCIFDIELFNVQPKFEVEHYFSISRCIAEDFSLNNGRIVSASHVITTLTEIDFSIANRVYSWDSMKITNLRIYNRGYLPKPIIESILRLYQMKTELKDVKGEEVAYMISKNMINACYGMMVTDIIRDDYVIDEDGHWLSFEAETAKQLNGYNKSFTRFLYYTWGVYVTAHARKALWDAIFEFGSDYVYADTDSIKGINFEKHLMFFRMENIRIAAALRKMSKAMQIDINLCFPKTKDGAEKMLGAWEIEKSYKIFKTAGAKRYIYQYPDGTLSLTVSGLNKKFAIPYLKESYTTIDDIFEAFEDGLVIPPGHTGKQTLTYIDDEISDYAFDYLGNRFEFTESSAVHMESQGFSMSQTDEYLAMLEGIQENQLR